MSTESKHAFISTKSIFVRLYVTRRGALQGYYCLRELNLSTRYGKKQTAKRTNEPVNTKYLRLEF